MEDLNNKLAVTEVLLGLLDEQVYSITLISTLYILDMANTEQIDQFLTPMVPTIFVRHPYHIELLTTVVRLAIPTLTPSFCETTASQYYLLQST